MMDFFKESLPVDTHDLSLRHFDYELPEALIAQMPTTERSASRLLLVDNGFKDQVFSNIIEQLHAGDVLVMNNTKVIKARLFGIKTSGGKVEVMLDRLTSERECIAQIRASKAPAVGSQILIQNTSGGEVFTLTVLDKNDRFYHLQCAEPLLPLLEQYGVLPLPPYIDRTADHFDANRYQTVFAKAEGAVAAPTAGLHFDDALLQRIEAKGVLLAYITLHVGAGTFLPVSSIDLDQHIMHQEWFEIDAKAAQTIQQAKRVVALGTTSLRALESAYAQQNPNGAIDWKLQPISNETRLFIRPPYTFGIVDALITNFHLPQSTLLMLVSAFSGVQVIRDAYNHAIEHQYRFFSYGDAMFLHTQRSNKR